MDHSLLHLFQSNQQWVKKQISNDPKFFERLAQQQSPKYLWIGCSDSRVPANQIIGLPPGEVFVHRNIANIVLYSDLNCLSVIEFAVDLLKIEHIIIVGHYGCSGVSAALHKQRIGLADNWLQHVQQVKEKHQNLLDRCTTEKAQLDRLVELNTIEQVVHACHTTIVNDAWKRGQKLAVHGWVYGLHDGLLRDLEMSIPNIDQLETTYQQALKNIEMERVLFCANDIIQSNQKIAQPNNQT